MSDELAATRVGVAGAAAKTVVVISTVWITSCTTVWKTMSRFSRGNAAAAPRKEEMAMMLKDFIFLVNL